MRAPQQEAGVKGESSSHLGPGLCKVLYVTLAPGVLIPAQWGAGVVTTPLMSRGLSEALKVIQEK